MAHNSYGKQIDLRQRAHQEMLANGFAPDFEQAVMQEVQTAKREAIPFANSNYRDLRSLLWSSIDNPDSKDLDQLEYAQELPNGEVQVLIAIADVDSFVAKGSATDKHAFNNTTSVYTGVLTYPMLPDDFSFDLTSLVADNDRLAIIIDLLVNEQGAVIKSEIYQGIVRNHAKLDYKTVGNWFEKGGKPPAKITAVKGLTEQLLLQSKIKDRIYAWRKGQGSLYLHTPEALTVAENGKVLDLELVEDNPARNLIENFMIAGNISISRFLEEKNIASLRRIVKKPERWPKIVEVASSYGEHLPSEPNAKALARFLLKRRETDPERFPDLSLTIVKLLGRGEYTVESPGQLDEGHFALAVHEYTHATAPNRRYPDLIMQRLVKAIINNKNTPYSLDELKTIAIQCTEKEDQAKKIERTMRKVAAAVLLSKHIGEIFEGIVTGVTPSGTYIRLLRPPAEGKIIRGEHGLDVGDKIKVRLVNTDPDQAFIDFERA